jgi:hypothetical protein
LKPEGQRQRSLLAFLRSGFKGFTAGYLAGFQFANLVGSYKS